MTCGRVAARGSRPWRRVAHHVPAFPGLGAAFLPLGAALAFARVALAIRIMPRAAGGPDVLSG